MQRRGRPRTRQAVTEAPTPAREQVDESVNVPESSAHPQPSQSVRPEPTLGPIPGQMEQMAEMLAAALQQPRELLRPKYIHKFITLLPKDYCLIPGNGAIKLVETKIYT